MMHRNLLITTLAVTTLAVLVPVATAAAAVPTDRVACEQANAAVLIKAKAAVTAGEALDASDTTINDTLIAAVLAAGVKVDSAVKAIQALGVGVVISTKLQADLVSAQDDLQAATKALNDAASSPELEAALVKAKVALALAIKVQAQACAEGSPPAPAPAPVTTPHTPVVVPTPATTPRTPVVVPAPQITEIPRGSVATGGGSA